MAKFVVRYLLEGDGSIPLFIEKGGYLKNANDEMIGLSVDEDKRHLPTSVIKLVKQDIIDRATALSLNDDQGNALDSQAKLSLVDGILEVLGVPDYE